MQKKVKQFQATRGPQGESKCKECDPLGTPSEFGQIWGSFGPIWAEKAGGLPEAFAIRAAAAPVGWREERAYLGKGGQWDFGGFCFERAGRAVEASQSDGLLSCRLVFRVGCVIGNLQVVFRFAVLFMVLVVVVVGITQCRKR